MTRRSLFAIGSRLLLGEALDRSVKPRAEAEVHLAPVNLDRGELRMAKGRGFHSQCATAVAEPDCASPRALHRAACRPTARIRSGAPREGLRSSCSACPFRALRGVRQGVIRVRPSSLLVSAFFYFATFFDLANVQAPR